MDARRHRLRGAVVADGLEVLAWLGRQNIDDGDRDLLFLDVARELEDADYVSIVFSRDVWFGEEEVEEMEQLGVAVTVAGRLGAEDGRFIHGVPQGASSIPEGVLDFGRFFDDAREILRSLGLLDSEILRAVLL